MVRLNKLLRYYQREAFDRVIAYIRKNSEPALLELSTGAGKSHIIAELAKWAKDMGIDVMVISDTKEIIQQDYLKFIALGYDASIYSASLNKKETTGNVTFCSVQTLARNLNEFERKISIIIIDEAHKVSLNEDSSYHRVMNHFYGIYKDTRVIGLTATPYRIKDGAIYGEDKFFKTLLYKVTMDDLVADGYLTPFEYFDEVEKYDFRDIKQTGGRFNAKQLDTSIQNKMKLTERIIEKVIIESEKRSGTTLIFSSTIKHAERILEALPPGRSEIITGKTKQRHRDDVISRLKIGEIKYCVNVSVLLVGFDCPNISVVAVLRPTESLSLFIQALGRGCRIHEGKDSCLIMDFAGNFERHGDIDDPIILDRVNKRYQNCEMRIPCPKCTTENGLFARRCIGVSNKKRCDYFFEAKECKKCGTLNDIAARICRKCDHELIDPDKKLTYRSSGNVVKTSEVFDFRLWPHSSGVAVIYTTKTGTVREIFWPNSKNNISQRIYTNKFLKEHKKTSLPGSFYRCGSVNIDNLVAAIDLFKRPMVIHYYQDVKTGFDKVTKKVFK